MCSDNCLSGYIQDSGMGFIVKYLDNVVTIKLDQSKCVGCRRCLEVCPRNVFKIVDKKALIINRDLCIECGACKMNCAYGALSVDSGVACATAYINAMITGGKPSCDCSDGGSTCC